jgi:hypothetical protein
MPDVGAAGALKSARTLSRVLGALTSALTLAGVVALTGPVTESSTDPGYRQAALLAAALVAGLVLIAGSTLRAQFATWLLGLAASVMLCAGSWLALSELRTARGPYAHLGWGVEVLAVVVPVAGLLASGKTLLDGSSRWRDGGRPSFLLHVGPVLALLVAVAILVTGAWLLAIDAGAAKGR